MTELAKVTLTVAIDGGGNGLMCPHCGVNLSRPVGGRPRRKIAVQPLLDAYRRLRSVRATARELDLPAGTVWHRLTEAGVLSKSVGGKA